MKIYQIGRFPSSSPNTYGVGKSLFSHHTIHTPPLSPSVFRFLGTKSVPNCDPREQIQNIERLGDALNVFDKMSGMRPLPSVIQFTQLLSRVVNLKEYSAALCLFKDICDLGISVNEYTMNIAMNCYCHTNRIDYGFSILGSFYKRGCVPDVFTFSTLLKGLFRENKIVEAQELFRKMVREKLCEMSVVAYGTLIDGLCKAGNTPVAIEMLRLMEKGRSSYKPNAHIYNMVIDRLCKDRMTDSALKLFDEMSDKGITPNVVTYGTVIDGFCKAGNTPMAIGMLRLMGRSSCEPNTHIYNMIIGGLCKDKMVDSALKLFDEMSEKEGIPPRRGVKADVVTYTTILQGLFRGGRDSCALKLFDEMQAIGLKPDFYTYSTVLDGLCRNGQVEQAVLFLDALEHKKGDLHLYIEYYNIVMDGLCKAKKLDAARAIFKYLAAKGLEPDVVTYTILITGCCEDGLLREAKELLLRMEHNTGLLPDEVTYNSIIRGNLKRGQNEDAEKLFEQMCAKGFSPDASTIELLRNLLGTTEHNPIILKMIQKLAPNTLKQN